MRMASSVRLRNFARFSMSVGIALLFGASSCFYSEWLPVILAALAVLITMTSNTVLIGNSTQSVSRYAEINGNTQTVEQFD